MSKNLWFLTEERPKKDVLRKIFEKPEDGPISPFIQINCLKIPDIVFPILIYI